MKKNLSFALFAVAAMVGIAQPSAAASITINMTTEFSGGASPQGTSPYMIATFEDIGAGLVQLTMDATNLVGTEFISEWSFNFDPSLDATDLDIDHVSGIEAVSVDQGNNGFQADGGGKYDIQFNFDIAPPGDRFGPNAVVTSVYTFDLAGITAESFNFISAPGGGNPNYLSAAHIQGIAVSPGSGWLGGVLDDGGEDEETPVVPEPASLILMGTGLLIVCRRFKKSSV